MRAQQWFVRELELINPKFTIKWLPRVQHWAVFEGERLSHHIQNEDKSYRPPDQRTLRKLRVDSFFTENPEALTEYLKDNPELLIVYIARGINGVKDYLAGY